MRGAPLKIYFDGGCRPNPGAMQSVVVVRGVVHHFPDLGLGDSNDAEWLALIAALRIAQGLGEPDFVLIGDSATVIAQANGTAPCRSARLAAHRNAFIALGSPRPHRIRRVGRSQNLAGIALEKIAAGA